MIIVKVFWNTKADGTLVDNLNMEQEDEPQSWYGPFEFAVDAVSWMEDALPDDTDVYDMSMCEIDSAEVDVEWLNDPKMYTDGYVRVDH